VTVVIFRLCTSVAIAVFVVMLITAYLGHRSRRRLEATSGSFAVELIWAVIPWLILIAAGTPAALVIMREARAQTPALGDRVTPAIVSVAGQVGLAVTRAV